MKRKCFECGEEKQGCQKVTVIVEAINNPYYNDRRENGLNKSDRWLGKYLCLKCRRFQKVVPRIGIRFITTK